MVLAIVGTYEVGSGIVEERPVAQPARYAPTLAAARRSATGPEPSAMDALAGPPASADLDVMTFNLRYASDRTPNSWAQRRPAMRTLLDVEKPDLIGTQEGLPAQLRDIRNDLGAGYDYIGMGRNGGDSGEHTAIFYNRARLAPQKAGNFWLSTTPQVPGSKSWGAGNIRMLTWALFTDLRSGTRFYAVNTHLDNNSENARRQAAKLITARLAAFDSLPMVLTGDFNSPAQSSSAVYQLLIDHAGFRDTWTTAPRRGPPYATIHNYRPLVSNGERDDWILTTPGVTALAALMNTYRRGSQYPSDHLPVQARLRLP
jgi:endonuclease/exonuclease/phosphatase family metal-dependent hydrolase